MSRSSPANVKEFRGTHQIILAQVMMAVAGIVIVSQAAFSQQIELRSPDEFQVFQRQTIQQGEVLLEGRLIETKGPLQFRLIGKPLAGELPGGWKMLEMLDASRFKTTLTVPAGGWYRLEIRAGSPDQAGPSAIVEHVGVGEVFVVAGQSNSTNYGSERQKVQSGLAVSFDGSDWRFADDPQPGVQDRSNKGSFIPAFGDAMAARYHVPIAVAAAGCGSTSVRQWLPKGHKIGVHPTTNSFMKEISPGQWESTGQLYDGLLRRIRALGPRGFRALLWHQGESDAGQARAGFADRQIQRRGIPAVDGRAHCRCAKGGRLGFPVADRAGDLSFPGRSL